MANSTDATPFFMRFLDQPEDLDTGVTAGADDKGDKGGKDDEEVLITMKYPSDGDEWVYEVEW